MPKAALTFLQKEDSNRNPPCTSLGAKYWEEPLFYLTEEIVSGNLLKQCGLNSPIYTPTNNPPVFPESAYSFILKYHSLKIKPYSQINYIMPANCCQCPKGIFFKIIFALSMT